MGLLLIAAQVTPADEPPAPRLTGPRITNQNVQLEWQPYPSAEAYRIFRADPAAPWAFLEESNGIATGGSAWSGPLQSPSSLYQLRVTPVNTNDVFAVTLLDRLGYGPSPDDLERVKAMGPTNYLQEQLTPETITESLSIDAPSPEADWQYVTATGTGSSSVLYIYLSLPGEGYLDDLKLVAGTVPEVGANLIRNGDFEQPLTTNDWVISSNHQRSAIDSTIQHSGTACLHLVADSGGSTRGSAIWQTLKPSLSSSKTYTLSYWYRPSTDRRSSVTVRLSGSGLTSTPGSLLDRLDHHAAAIEDLRAWHVLRAIESRRQLLEVLLQFLENHFVTEYAKSVDYFSVSYPVSSQRGRLATELEYRENRRWRQALLNPACTFYDLLRISAESPAMIIYLDTVNSKGNAKNVANENYARELLELFTFGVDNGYDQNDIVALSKVWTGWTLNIVDAANQDNPLALRTTNVLSGVTNNLTVISNLVGVWAFNYKAENHNTAAKTIFPGKTVPVRFGAPYAGRAYELALPARTGKDGLQDGYDVLAHLANQPFTQEFISVKLCRLFVHDDFTVGYDFTDPNLSAEGRLVRDCMRAWEESNPRGQIRPVLSVLFDSELFRGQGASLQRVKNPLKFTVSTLRALRARTAAGAYTAHTDGYSLATPMNRMGGMTLFNRADPDGYPEAGPAWISTGTLAERIRFVQTTLMTASDSSKADGISGGNKNLADPVALLQLKLPGASWTDAASVVDYFLSLFFPAEGKANLDLYRTGAIRFLNTADDGTTAAPFAGLSPSSTAYDSRVRGMVALLLTLPRFQEQ